MALTAGTGTRYDSQGLREDLSDFIYDISPMEVPFMTGAGRGAKANQTLVEWQTDELEAPDGNNAQLEGDNPSFLVPDPTVRVGNYTQIMRKTLSLSDTLEAVDKAGRRSELAYQLAKRGREIKRDQETIYLQNQGGSAGSVGTPRVLASLGAWLKTNTDFGAGGADPTYTAGVPDAPRTDGTPRPFTEEMLQAVHQSCWENGANPTVLMVGAFNKREASQFTGIAQKTIDIRSQQAKPMATISAVDVYVDDFGTLRIVANRFQRPRDAWLIDFEHVSVRYLRPHKRVKLAKIGDAEQRMLITENTLEVKNEAALGAVYDLTSA